jgi:DHA2 family multidrug resistance protein
MGFIVWSYYDLAHLSLDAGFGTLVPILLIMGCGMPMMFVTMSTLSLSQVPREDMTEASSLFTLARRVGGNLGYTLAATVVSYGSQLHRSELARHISPLNPVYQSYHERLVETLTSRGIAPFTAEHAAVAIANETLNRQARMLAYNDVSWVFGALFLVAAPLILFIPAGKKRARPEPTAPKKPAPAAT